ncbi:MAG: glycosyltransferase [Gemmatimonadota bacterium]
MTEAPQVARRRILCFTTSLGGGGAEKHLVRVANHLDPARWEVLVAVMRRGGSYESELGSQLTLRSLDARMVAAPWRLRTLLREWRPALLWSVSEAANWAAVLGSAGLRSVRTCISVQIPLTIQYAGTGYKPWLMLEALRIAYPRADHIVAICDGVKQDLEMLRPGLGARSEVIYNAGFDQSVLDLSLEPLDGVAPVGEGPIIAACGRLAPAKGFHDLLAAFAAVRATRPARLWLIGDGPLRGELEAQASRLGILDAVWFAGFRRNPYQLMRAANVFALSSHWEGFANVIVEAMAVGVPVVSTDCPHGPAEIIRAGESGLLVPVGAPAHLGAALCSVLDDPALAGRLSVAGRQRAEAFEARAIAAQYAASFEQLTRGRD